ncbi:MAG: outer membrane lipoprotein carrier protein LolA [Spirochaetales bacterium]|nr:outer membrane lipoprotein carrier protein LolA [Spirochaetales bacterium]
MKKSLNILLFLITPLMIFSQQTAGDFFKTISDKYSEINAYTANFKITSGLRGNIVQEGKMTYMNPNLLRMDYMVPEEQVLNVNSRKISIYVPAHDTLFEQTINSEEDALVIEASGLTSQGLTLFNTNYSISYVNGPNLEALDDNNPQEVYKLRLYPRRYTEPFSFIIISISTDGFIRRLQSTTRTGEEIVFDIVDIDTSVKLDKSFFEYNAPPSANTIKDFLFDQGDVE